MTQRHGSLSFIAVEKIHADSGFWWRTSADHSLIHTYGAEFRVYLEICILYVGYTQRQKDFFQISVEYRSVVKV